MAHPALHHGSVSDSQDEPGVRRFLGVFRYSRRALELVWSTSHTLTILFAILTLIAGILPAGVAYLGQLIVDAVVYASQHTGSEATPVLRLVLAEGRYGVRGGDILSRYPLPGGKTAVLVRVDIPREDTLTLEVDVQTSSTFSGSAVADEQTAMVSSAGEAVPLDQTGAPVIELEPSDLGTDELAPFDPGATIDSLETPRYRVALPLVL